MDYKRAIRAGVTIWEIAVLLFTIAGNFSIIGNPELQANIILAIAILPLTWFGAKYYYRKGANTPGYQLALIMISITILLDVLITVPLLIIPMEGSYSTFFSATGFWIIVVEYVGVIILYEFLNRKSLLNQIQS